MVNSRMRGPIKTARAPGQTWALKPQEPTASPTFQGLLRTPGPRADTFGLRAKLPPADMADLGPGPHRENRRWGHRLPGHTLTHIPR